MFKCIVVEVLWLAAVEDIKQILEQLCFFPGGLFTDLSPERSNSDLCDIAQVNKDKKAIHHLSPSLTHELAYTLAKSFI